jgi:hypothetical protein
VPSTRHLRPAYLALVPKVLEVPAHALRVLETNPQGFLGVRQVRVIQHAQQDDGRVLLADGELTDPRRDQKRERPGCHRLCAGGTQAIEHELQQNQQLSLWEFDTPIGQLRKVLILKAQSGGSPVWTRTRRHF